ncbi:hypothetical protein HPB49_005096 [Dermacentor silvarum]|uniref:Uncharacterized protein n=1 Tax=Dermacentor silvarum TaxID=543639 RepID=A0ACB8CJE1_DERSI|nr:hypothetical protein HPB49_005096 [Dermacentor silvarum]
MLVVANFFTAKMKAALTVRHQTGQRVDSAAELADRTGMKVYMVAGTTYPKLLSISPRDYDRKVYRMLKPSSFLTYSQIFSAAVLDEVVAGKAVILSDRTTAMYKLAALCNRYPDHEFYISRDRFFLNPLVVYYSRKQKTVMHLMKKWEKRVKWLNEAGVISKWHRDTISLGADFSRCPKVQQGEAETLDFEHHLSVFLLILAGSGLAFAVFVAEILLAEGVGRSCNRAALRVRRRVSRPGDATHSQQPDSPAPSHEASCDDGLTNSTGEEPVEVQQDLFVEHSYAYDKGDEREVVNRLKDSVTQLEEKLEEANATIAALRQQLEDSKKSNGETMKFCNTLQQKNRCLKLELSCTYNQLKEARNRKENEFNYDALVKDEKRLKYYTGFKTQMLLETFWSLLEEDVNSLQFWKMKETTNQDRKFVLDMKTQLILVLMRLRLGLDGEDLAYR